jgi:hypothetical protein
MNTSAVVLFVRLPDILNGIGDTEDDNPAQALEPSAAALVNDKYHSTKGTLLVFILTDASNIQTPIGRVNLDHCVLANAVDELVAVVSFNAATTHWFKCW